MDLSLAPGTMIQEMQLADSLGISRTPVREALTRLKQEDWISEGAGQRVHVRTLTARDVEHIYEMRILLEPRATVRFAEQATSEQLRTLEKLIARARDELDHGSYSGFLQFHQQYQRMLIHGCANDLLRSALLNLEDLMTRFRNLAGQDPERHVYLALAEHKEILAALLHRDIPVVERAVTAHLEAAGARVVAQIAATESGTKLAKAVAAESS